MRKRALSSIILLITILVSGYFLVCPVDQADMVARAQSGPDLTVEVITSSPETPTTGDEVTFTATIANQGTTTSGECQVAYYIDDVYIDAEYIPPMDPGASTEHTFTWTAEIGTHTITVVADYTGQVNESNEANNRKTYTLSTLGPDLIIDSITWSPSEPPVASTVIFTITIKNQGSDFALSGRVHFYIDGISRGYKDVERLYPEETETLTFSWFAKAGSHEIKAIVDKDDSVTETDESNNEMTITLSPLLPDLLVDEISLSPAEPSVSDNVSFTVSVSNQGGSRSGMLAIDFYIDDALSGTEWVDEIDAGASANVTFSWIAEVGTHNITAVISTGGVITESDVTNNEKSLILSPLVSDLIVQDIAWSPDNPALGESVTFTVSILNQGGGCSSESTVDFLIDDETIDYRTLEPIGANGTKTASFTWRARAGSHQIQALVDPENEVTESDETNNDRTIAFPAQPPDLTIEQITWAPSEPAIGDTVTFNVTVKNQGEAISDYAYIVYYIDDVQLTPEQVNPMSYNVTDNKTFRWTATAGKHLIKAHVDFTEMVAESDETNNEFATTLTPIGPDLIIESIDWSRNDPRAGEMVAFSVTVHNNGGVMSSASIVHLYVDENSRGYQDIPKLEPGAKATRTFDWKFVPGLHDIRAVTDDTNLVVENNEANNEMLIAYPIPDLTLDALIWSPIEPAIGEKVTLTAYVQNIGSLRSEAFQLYFYVDDDIQDRREVPPLEAGTRVTETFAWDAAAGPHVLTVLADGAKAIIEGAENNNQEMVNFSIPAPDLVIESISWPDEEPPTGDNVTFTVTIRNQGDAEAGYVYVSYFVDGEYLTSEQVRPLQPDAETEAPFSTLMSQTGPHTIRVVLDEGNKVLESDETNNEKAVTISTESVTPPADTKKPEPKPASPAPAPLTPEEEDDNKMIILFAVVILVFTTVLVLSVLREFRRRNE